jgi:hypothetical protein
VLHSHRIQTKSSEGAEGEISKEAVIKKTKTRNGAIMATTQVQEKAPSVSQAKKKDPEDLAEERKVRKMVNPPSDSETKFGNNKVLAVKYKNLKKTIPEASDGQKEGEISVTIAKELIVNVEKEAE